MISEIPGTFEKKRISWIPRLSGIPRTLGIPKISGITGKLDIWDKKISGTDLEKVSSPSGSA